jgi:hypothetical protein
MTRVHNLRRICAASAVVALGIVAGVSGQVAQPPATGRSQMDELLSEVRAIRADLDRAAAASLRGQLLAMRLQLQEQRIAAIARQLSDVRERLRANAGLRAAMAGPLKMLLGNAKEASESEKGGMDMLLGPLKQQLAGLDKSDAELRLEETELTAQLHDEQNRWTMFNGQVEELERASSGRSIR